MKRHKKRIILGLTGSFGSGKSTVARIFKSFGAEIIDADNIAHKVIEPDTKVYKKIINTFGRGIVSKDRSIAREKLAKIVFDNKNLLKRLNKIVHPEVSRIIKYKIKSSKAKFMIIDAPLLIEAELHKVVDKLIVVKTNKEMQIKRLKERFPFSRSEILKRIRHQIPLKQKLRSADFIIDNNKTVENTKKQVERIRRSLWKN